MDLDQIQNEWKEDAKIDPENRVIESIKIPKLHEKYLRFLNESKKELRTIEISIKKLKNVLKLYYKGELTKEELESVGRKPWLRKAAIKSDIEEWILNDEEYIDANYSYAEIQDKIETLKEILKMIHNRSFQIKNATDYDKFLAGN